MSSQKRRQADMRACLELLAERFGFTLELEELDTEINRSHDVTNAALRGSIVKKIQEGSMARCSGPPLQPKPTRFVTNLTAAERMDYRTGQSSTCAGSTKAHFLGDALTVVMTRRSLAGIPVGPSKQQPLQTMQALCAWSWL